MPRINLLPWREERLKEQQQAFGIAAVAVVAAGALLVYLAMQMVNGMVDHQRARNAFLQDEIRLLDARIAEIRELEQRKSALLARMNIIESLQTSRPEIVHLFEELVTTLPEGVYLTSLRQTGVNLEFKGIAQSSARVSAYMRAIEASDYLSIGRLEGIERIGNDAERAQQFTLQARQVSPSAPEDDVEAGR